MNEAIIDCTLLENQFFRDTSDLIARETAVPAMREDKQKSANKKTLACKNFGFSVGYPHELVWHFLLFCAHKSWSSTSDTKRF